MNYSPQIEMKTLVAQQYGVSFPIYHERYLTQAGRMYFNERLDAGTSAALIWRAIDLYHPTYYRFRAAVLAWRFLRRWAYKNNIVLMPNKKHVQEIDFSYVGVSCYGWESPPAHIRKYLVDVKTTVVNYVDWES